MVSLLLCFLDGLDGLRYYVVHSSCWQQEIHGRFDTPVRHVNACLIVLLHVKGEQCNPEEPLGLHL